MLSPKMIQAIMRAGTHYSKLSERELEVLAIIIKGLSLVEIANQMQISTLAVEQEVKSILSKLNIDNDE